MFLRAAKNYYYCLFHYLIRASELDTRQDLAAPSLGTLIKIDAHAAAYRDSRNRTRHAKIWPTKPKIANADDMTCVVATCGAKAANCMHNTAIPQPQRPATHPELLVDASRAVPTIIMATMRAANAWLEQSEHATEQRRAALQRTSTVGDTRCFAFAKSWRMSWQRCADGLLTSSASTQIAEPCRGQ